MWVYVQFSALQLDSMLALFAEKAGNTLPQSTAADSENSAVVVLYTEQQQKVVQSSAAALELGIQPGCSLSDAWVLADNLAPYPYREAQQRQLLQQIAADLYHVFAVISLDPPAGLWLDLQPMRKLYQDVQHGVQQLHLQLQPWQVNYRYGLAKTPILAKMQACSGISNAADIPLQYLPCSDLIRQKLERMGLHTLGALQAIPRPLAGQRLGQELVLLLARIQGEQAECLRYFQPPQWFYQRVSLMAEAHSWQALRFPLQRILQQLEHFLEGRQQATRHLQLQLYHRDIPPTQITIGLAHGGYLASELANFCQLKMQALQLPAAVLELGLQAKQLQAREQNHNDLLKNGQLVRKSLPRLLNELQLRLGKNRVVGLQVKTEWLPEQAWQRTAAGNPLVAGTSALVNKQDRQAGVAPQQITPALPYAGQRPQWLLPQAMPVHIEQWRLLRGPERQALPWWQQAVWPPPAGLGNRDYWLACNQQGQPGWLYYDDQQQAWWLHGWFC